jgi:sarcosine oxidase, subunit gamma
MPEPAAAAHAVSPLAGIQAELTAAGAREVAFLAQVSLRAGAAAAARLPFALPREPNTWARGDGREVLWLGPDEWLLVAPPGQAPALVAELDAALDGLHRSVVDVSAYRTVVELAGDGRLDLLAQGCGLDLHPRSWRDGHCAQTLLDRVPVLLQERDQATRVFVRTSFATHLAGWLLRASAPG